MSDIEQVSKHVQTLPAGPRTVILDYIGRLQAGKRMAEERVAVLQRRLARVRATAKACGYTSILEQTGDSDE